MRSTASGVSSLAVILAFAIGGCTAKASFFPGDGGVSDGGPSSVIAAGDGGKKKDTGTTSTEEEEEGTDAGKTDGGKKDSGKDGSITTVACTPESISGFSPSWKSPKTLHASSCTAANAEKAVDCMFDPNADQTLCDAFNNDSANQACIQCVYTDKSSATYGPLILEGSFASLNLAGCIARLSNDTTSTSCGAKVQALSQCRDAACASCPDPSVDQTSFDNYQQCQTDSEASECATYANAISCADSLAGPGGVAEQCVSGASFLANARTLAKLFCVP